MTVKILPNTDREGAIEQGFGGFNKGTHIPIELTPDEITTITVKAGKELVTLCFIPQGDANGSEFECLDVAVHTLEPHKAITMLDGKLQRQDSGITAILLNREHYKKD